MITRFKDVDSLSPEDFERFVGSLFKELGWEGIEYTGLGKDFKHGDGGLDIIANKSDRLFGIEVKQRSPENKVDVSALNQLVAGGRLFGILNLVLVTNGYFTTEVTYRALSLGIDLIDRDRLHDLWVSKATEIGRSRIEPRPYQKEIIERAIAAVAEGSSRLLVEMATGLGKTYLAALLVRALLQKGAFLGSVLFLAHQLELLVQGTTAFKNVFGLGNFTFSASFGGSEFREADFVFGSFDTFYNQLGTTTPTHFALIIVDEAHHVPAKTYSQVVEYFTPQYLVGLTATPFREDQKDVRAFFGGRKGFIGQYDLVWALRQNLLAFPKYIVLTPEESNPLEDDDLDTLILDEIDARLLLEGKEEQIVEKAQTVIGEAEIEDPKGIVFCKSIEHISSLLPFFQPGKATFVHSKLPKETVRENIRRFRDGDVSFILVCDLFNEGIDIPETNVLIFLRPTQSRRIWMQQLGRGLRKTKKKSFVLVLDFVGSVERLREIKYFEVELQANNGNRSQGGSEDILRPVIEIEFDERAAKILKLLEERQMELKSRIEALDAIRAFHEDTGEIPRIEEIDELLPSLSSDQISALFGNYFRFLKVALGGDSELPLLFAGWMEEAIRSLKEKSYGVIPSLKAVQNALSIPSLEFAKLQELEQLLPLVQEYQVGLDSASLEQSGDSARDAGASLSDEARFHLIKSYGSTEEALEMVPFLPLEILNCVREEFGSEYLFVQHCRALLKVEE